MGHDGHSQGGLEPGWRRCSPSGKIGGLLHVFYPDRLPGGIHGAGQSFRGGEGVRAGHPGELLQRRLRSRPHAVALQVRVLRCGPPGFANHPAGRLADMPQHEFDRPVHVLGLGDAAGKMLEQRGLFLGAALFRDVRRDDDHAAQVLLGAGSDRPAEVDLPRVAAQGADAGINLEPVAAGGDAGELPDQSGMGIGRDEAVEPGELLRLSRGAEEPEGFAIDVEDPHAGDAGGERLGPGGEKGFDIGREATE